MRKKSSFRNYEFILGNFRDHFGDIELSFITSEGILIFMSEVSDGTKQPTKRLRFNLLSALFNYINKSVDPDLQNPCDNPALQKLFRAEKLTQFKILEKTDNLVGIHLKPNDLRGHAATYASRSGTPLEIVSKVLLRHSNLSTTQRYLGRISDVEAMRWIDNLHG